MSGNPDHPADAAARVRALDRLRVVGSFAALVSHELNNRLAVVRSGIELLAAGYEDRLSPEHRALLLREFDGFLGDFNLGVEMTRGDFGEIGPVAARELVDDAVAEYRPSCEARGVSLELEHAAGRGVVAADGRLLRLVVLNLLRNAREAARESARPRIAVRTGAAENRFLIEVADSGPGLGARLAEGLWREPGRGGEGTAGLGLSLCRDALIVMQGTIALAAAGPGEGARFRASLPLL